MTKQTDPSNSNIAINSDPELLTHFRLNDSTAAQYLGCSHESLAGRRAESSAQFLSIVDIFILASAVRQLGRAIDTDAIRDYVDRTRKPTEAESEVYALLQQLLDERYESIELKGTEVVVFLMPTAFAQLQQEVIATWKSLLDALPDRTSAYVIASTYLRAQVAGELLGISCENRFWRDLVDRYPPSIVTYDAGTFRWYTYAEDGPFSAPAQDAAFSDFVRNTLPWEIVRACDVLEPA